MSLCALLAVFGCGGGGGSKGNGPTQVYATTFDGHLIRFELGSPNVDLDVEMTGLVSPQIIIGIDFRKSDGLLYALESSGQLYTINTATGAATPVGESNGNLPINNAGLSFNDVTGRIRYVIDNDTNFRINADNGEIMDGDAFTAGVQTDTDIHPAGSVSAIAYTPPIDNQTTLYGIDYDDNLLVRIGGVGGSPSPSAGLRTDIGPLGIDITGGASLDFASDGTAVLTYSPSAGVNNVYTVNITTGAATLVGNVDSARRIASMAVRP